MQSAPIASERFQDALPLIPGVVRGPDGLLNINGTRSNQSALMFNNADGTDPVTGEDAIELPIDAVSAVQVRGAAFAPEFGLSAGAVTTVETQRAGDAWHVTVNDLEPRPPPARRRIPRGSNRGRRGSRSAARSSRASSVSSSRSSTSSARRACSDFPAFESDTKVESLESFSRADWTVDANQSLHRIGDGVAAQDDLCRLEHVQPAARDAQYQNHNVLASASDQIIVGASGVLETRVSVKQFDSTIYPSQGSGPMVLAPDVNSGSYFNDQDRTSHRAEWLTTYAFTPLGPAI